jgi:hypothetical protein
MLENTLERRKDMLDKTSIIPRSSPAATKIIKNYSKFPKNKRSSPQRTRRPQRISPGRHKTQASNPKSQTNPNYQSTQLKTRRNLPEAKPTWAGKNEGWACYSTKGLFSAALANRL